MRSRIGEDTVESIGQDSSAQGEKIFVAVRIRPLNAKELAKKDVSDWECINNSTVTFKNAPHERSSAQITYSFDRVFGCDCSTKQVYEEAAKRVTLSALNGINSIIFAYGQTSSGKTYTMSGITRHAVADIYDYIDDHPERDFVLKFSAMEIYNESVKDLLCPDVTSLRLLDDPEKGTIVEKLTEVTVRDSAHLYELLSVCEAQRQTGETFLNEISSRSHQILRLNIESEGRRYLGAEHSKTLAATVNFVDLAGSERSSQTMSGGTRLKEGSHINRSLLTLGTVIRKLSKGRNAHIPYRDSKLTRILQNSLGGNARTAIICTMSPARRHVDQSKNTLLFATCAKQVRTNARVNVVMSEKAVVKQLQGELAKLENELKNLRSQSASSVAKSALTEKEALIEKMEAEMKELTYQRDIALSRVDTILRSRRTSMCSSLFDMNQEKRYFLDEHSVSELIESRMSSVSSIASHFSNKDDWNTSRKIENSIPENNEEHFLSDSISPTEYIDKYFGPDPYKDWEKIAQETSKKVEDNCKEVPCMETDSTKNNVVTNLASPQNVEHVSEWLSSCSSDSNAPDPHSEEIAIAIVEYPHSEAQKEMECIQKSEADYPVEVSEVSMVAAADSICIEDSRDALRSNTVDEEEKNIDKSHEDFVDKQSEDFVDKQVEVCLKDIAEVKQQEPVKQIECVLVIEKALPLEQPKEAADVELEKPKETADVDSCHAKDDKQSATDWSSEFERTMKEIILLWDVCQTPLTHRTYFFLLMKGDPSDAVYVEVELRRLTFLKNSINRLTKDFLYNSTKALNREREMLRRRMLKKFSSKDREALFTKWGIDLKSKQRRFQLCQKLWTDPGIMEHINESAAVVAKLVGIMEPDQAPKEIFGLSILPNQVNLGFSSWWHSLPSMIQF